MIAQPGTPVIRKVVLRHGIVEVGEKQWNYLCKMWIEMDYKIMYYVENA